MNIIKTLDIQDNELSYIISLCKELAEKYHHVENNTFMKKAPVYALELPITLIKTITEYKSNLANTQGLLIRNLYRKDFKLQTTPSHWNAYQKENSLIILEFVFFLISQLLGQPFGWSTYQNGKVIHDIIPITGHETKQVSSSSEVDLELHMDECFDECRADYIGLYCLRNEQKAATIIADVDVTQLPNKVIDILFENKFCIFPDDTHKPELNFSDSNVFIGIMDLFENKKMSSIFHGNRAAPFLRVDPFYTDMSGLNEEQKNAINVLMKHLKQRQNSVVLQPGDLLFIDNFRSVHGRTAFKMNDCKNNRWLKRLDLCVDMKKSAHRRSKIDSFII